MQDVRNLSIEELGQYFELSIISMPTKEQLEAQIKKAIEYNLKGILVAPFLVSEVIEAVKGTNLQVGSAISFPFGSEYPEVKALEAKMMKEAGVDCIDFVMNVPALLSGHPEIVEKECRLIREAAPGVTIKMILEVCYLTDDQIRQAVQIASANGIDYAKSSTGQTTGPTMEQICLLVDECKKANIHSKVAGVKFPRAQNAYAFLIAGIELIGTQQPFEIIDGIKLLRERNIFG